MSIFSAPQQFALSVVDKVSPACGKTLRSVAHQPAENEDLRRRLDQAEQQIREISILVDTLNHDLDESRRLNLRAAELMDLAFTELSK